ncbi:Integrase core domain [Haploplasma axanthum]|uniref:Integrase core domain n=2 Tax=Haploplasma axanthum TaxID=29552 RepID=A0A449BFH0_HAPAX|nr:Integrase core domain [Haploplasma axanthum]VEU81186.1 Integrase core domain [Haploplasma axanthum]
MVKIAGVSKSGYYSYLSDSETRQTRTFNDEEAFEFIMSAYRYKGFNKGARMIKMTLEDQFNIIMNIKKIRRLMKKFGLFCPIRKANPYRRMAKALKTSHVAPNKLERKFKEGNPNQILLTDITYLTYDLNKRAYLSAIKDGVTNEIHAYQVSKSLDIKFVEDTMKDLDKIELASDALINSDQGSHYTSLSFQRMIKELNLEQSMSRRGNCWDNAPIESFFGHMKDEINLIDCKTFEEVKEAIDKYIDYYNNHRYQWNLKRMTPKNYGDMFRNKNKKDGLSLEVKPSLIALH